MVLKLLANEVLKDIAKIVLVVAVLIALAVGNYYLGHKNGWKAHANKPIEAPKNLRIKIVEVDRDAYDARKVRALENIAGSLTDLNNKFIKIAGDPWD